MYFVPLGEFSCVVGVLGNIEDQLPFRLLLLPDLDCSLAGFGTSFLRRRRPNRFPMKW